MDLNLSSFKWCSLINCNWCVSLDIQSSLALSKYVLLQSNYNRGSDLAGWLAGRVCGNQLLEWLMSPSPKSQDMFASAFS